MRKKLYPADGERKLGEEKKVLRSGPACPPPRYRPERKEYSKMTGSEEK